MKELLEKILKYLPEYLKDFGSLFVSPKQFIAEKLLRPEECYERALIFLAVTVSLVILANSSFQSAKKDIWGQLSVTSIVGILAVALGGTVIRLAWRIVGGKAPFKSFFVTYAYFFSISVVMTVLFNLLSIGVFKVFAPDLFIAINEAHAKRQPMPVLNETWIPAICLLIRVFGYLLASAWAMIGWGAYRRLNGLGKGRSILAFIITGILGIFVIPVIFFIEVAVG